MDEIVMEELESGSMVTLRGSRGSTGREEEG